MKKTVTINRKQRLYVIPQRGGYTCLGFDVCERRINRLAPELAALGHKIGKCPRKGTLAHYRHWHKLIMIALKHFEATGWKTKSELTPELIGLEGKRVEVVHQWQPGKSEVVRFWVGKSTGWIPCHLAIARRNYHAGYAVCLGEILSVRVLY